MIVKLRHLGLQTSNDELVFCGLLSHEFVLTNVIDKLGVTDGFRV